MSNPTLRYDKMVENALRGVVREALAVAADRGLPGAHHFFITFRTDHPGVEMPEFLHAQHPEEMTIVLQHQFWGLEVNEEQFAVTLSFHSQGQRLTVPLEAITAFADPSVKFGLEFKSDFESAPVEEAAPPPVQPKPAERDSTTADVVRLDAFRKK